MRWVWAFLISGAALADSGNPKVRICDKTDATKCAAVNASGQVSIAGTISASTTGHATAAAPTYVEGTDNPLSLDLTGNIRTLATATTAAKATAAAPAYVEGSTSPISQDLAGNLRTIVGNFPASQAVTGTFWQATQPVSGTFWQATQPVSGTVAATQSGAPWTVTGTITPADAFTNPATAVNGNSMLSGFNGTTWDRLVSAGNNNDGEAVATKGVLDIESHEMVFNGTTWDRQRGNTTATYSQGPTANNTAITQNPVLIAGEVITAGTNPTAATTGNQRRPIYTTEGVTVTQEGSTNRFSCFVQNVTATTQCQAAPAAGLRAYVTSVSLSNEAATVQTLDVVFGTGAACVTGTTALTHKWQFGTVATTTSPFVVSASFPTPLVPTAANAICVRPSAATAFGATLTGYIAP